MILGRPQRRFRRRRRAAAMVEYAILLGAIALVAVGAVTVFGRKTADMIGTMAAILPGAHAADNNPILAGGLVETSVDPATGAITVDVQAIISNSNQPRLGLNVFGEDTSALVVQPQ